MFCDQDTHQWTYEVMVQTEENSPSKNSSVPSKTPSHDWEDIFESPETGFIPLLRQAKTIDGLREGAQLIIRSLFTRDNDAQVRVEYEQNLKRMFPGADGEIPSMDQGLHDVVQLLREIKEYRLRRVAENEAQLNEKAPAEATNPEPERREVDEDKPLPGLEIPQTQENPALEDDEQIVYGIFTDLLCQRINMRLDVLNLQGNCKAIDDNPLPFILSKNFAQYFEELLKEHFIPAFLDDSRALVARAMQQPAERRQDYLVDQFEGRVSSQNLWDKWKDVWISLVHRKELPQKPEAEKKAGLLGGLKKKKKKVPTWRREMTVDEWKVRVQEIKAGNKKAKDLWRAVAIDSDVYQPPEFEDEKMLMNLFAVSAKGMQSHINAMRQIVEQGESVGRNLSSYANGKNIDLPLLAACHQYPDLFLGQQQSLKAMLVGMDDIDIAETYPQVRRFLASHL